MKFTYMKTPLNKYTFSNKRIRAWVESHCEGVVLNLFAGKTKLDIERFEIRVDIDENMNADFCMDALTFCEKYIGRIAPFTILLDPPYSYRKSMEMYNGHIMSPFNALKNAVLKIIQPGGIVITFGYHSVSMGKTRSFEQEHVLLMSHGGAIHDTIAVIERHTKKDLKSTLLL